MTFTTSIVEAAATVAAACPESSTITIAPAIDGVSKQPLRARDGSMIYSFSVSGPHVAETVDSYQCKPDSRPFVNPTISVYTAVFTEMHRRLSRLHAREPISMTINCREVCQ